LLTRRANVDLPLGPGKRIDVMLSGGGGSEYVLAPNDVFYTFGCFVPAGDPPDDRWLSVAETFEFLPTEE